MAQKIQNYIRINGEYVKQEDIPKEQMKVISWELMVRLAAAMGYVPVESEVEKQAEESEAT